jgi:hypothetical protein
MKKSLITERIIGLIYLFLVCSLSTSITPAALAADCPVGDLNRDCKVNFFDFELMAENWLEVEPNLPLGTVIINEVMAHAHAAAPDWIELYNTTGSTINIGGWYLSDSDSPLTQYKIPNGTTIAPYGYIVFYENVHFPFGLSENGETVYLSFGLPAPNTTWYKICDDRKFGASETGVSLGRYITSTGDVKFVAMDSNTPGQSNAYPKVGPIVINEIMYDPLAGTDAEYIELHNIKNYPVTLQIYNPNVAWKFIEGPHYTFPLGTTIPANGYLIVAKTSNANDFRDYYDFYDYNTPVLGPFADGTKLSNDGENVEISMPGDLDPCDPDIRYYIRIDNVSYSDGSRHENFPGLDPWPKDPDLYGESLNRINPNLYGDDVNNWVSGSANPGQ